MRARATQAAALTAFAAEPRGRAVGAAVLVAYNAVLLAQARVMQEAAMVVYSAVPQARTTDAAIMTAYQTGVSGLNRTRAWTFDFDGHVFYVLNLGEQGTFCYDVTTGEWSQFQTGGYGIWNMLRGTVWNTLVVGADAITAQLWTLDPDALDDQGWRPIQHIVTGGLPSRSRTAIPLDAFRLTVSSGVIAEDGAQLRMRFSDDNGKTWGIYYDIVLTEGAYTQEIEYMSLGTIMAPGRVFEISDIGGQVRIDGADAELGGVSDG